MEGGRNVASSVQSPILVGTNNEITTIDQMYPKESTASGDKNSSFKSIDWRYSLNDDNYIQFSKEIVIGQKAVNIDRIYGDGMLFVDINGSKYPSSEAYVNAGNKNTASGYIHPTNKQSQICIHL